MLRGALCCAVSRNAGMTEAELRMAVWCCVVQWRGDETRTQGSEHVGFDVAVKSVVALETVGLNLNMVAAGASERKRQCQEPPSNHQAQGLSHSWDNKNSALAGQSAMQSKNWLSHMLREHHCPFCADIELGKPGAEICAGERKEGERLMGANGD